MIAFSFMMLNRPRVIAAMWLVFLGMHAPLAADLATYQNTELCIDGIGKSTVGREIAGVMGRQAANHL